MKSGRVPGFILTLILLFAAGVSAQTSPFHGLKEARPFTRNLPRIDRVELMHLKLEGDLWRGEILATKVLTDTEAQSVATLWRDQTYLPGYPVCHFPPYAIKFFAQDKLLAYATICWACNDIYFLTPRIEKPQQFGAGDRKGKQLLALFRKAFPGSNTGKFPN